MDYKSGLKLNLDEFLLKTATIDERLSALFIEISSQKINTLEAAEQLAQWCNASTSGDWKKFAAWLSCRKTSFDKALSRLSTLHKNPEVEYPEWIKDSEWIIRALTSESLSKPVVNRQNCEFLYPFSDLFNEVLEVSLAAQTQKCKSIDLNIFSQEALDDLTRALLKELTDLSAKVIYQLFIEQKVVDDNEVLSHENDSLYYLKFLAWMRVTGWSEVLKRWPVLIRLLAVATRQWINNSSQIIHRLSETANQAKNSIHKTPLDSNRIIAIDINVSDAHNNGQSVAIISFDNGIKLVYKPKDLKLDLEFEKFLKYISSLGSPMHLEIPKVFIATHYGYTEFITYKSCLRDEEVKHFFTQMGGWLALFYIFIATDMHEENFIAHGKTPYPIDLEMMLHPLIRDEDITLASQDASKEAQNILMSSVMMIGMLPSFSYGPNGEPLYSYGLKPETDPVIVEGWANINSKNMRRAKFKKNGKSYFNVPELKDAPVDLKKYIPNITDGFNSLAKFLLENRSTILNSASLHALNEVTSRRALRRTHFYFMLGHRLKDPQFLSNGVLWSAQADFLVRPFKFDGSNEFGATLIFSEINALLNLNIPYFTISTNGLSLHDEMGYSEAAGRKSGFDHAKERFNNFTFDEIAWQSHLIEMSAYSITSKEHTASKPRPIFASNSKMLSDQELEDEVKSIYNKIKQSAIEINGSCTWLGFQWIDAHNRVGQLAPLGLNLYEGNAGMALFLAAYANVFADQDSKNDAMAVLKPFLKAMDEQDFNAGIRQIGLGGATGVGGQIYTLTTLAELMESDELQERAVILADLITTDMIHSDRKFDVIGGGSGAILGLIKLYRATNEKRVLAKAEQIAQFLLESRRSIDGFILWPFDETNRALTGFSHGTAGYAYTFSLLAKATNNPKYQNAAEECLAYDESVFSHDEGNWPDKRNTTNLQNPSKKLLFLCQWCHGSGGIGLSRIAMKQYGDQRDTSTNLDIFRAIQSIKKNWPHDLDHLCCGNTGNAELLLESGLKLGNSDDLYESRKMLSQVIIQARESDGYKFAHASPVQYNVSLFTGISGIGYSILRQLKPNKIPNVLIWE
jgi:type 2 lantibiotic biosynthesis protein LanM